MTWIKTLYQKAVLKSNNKTIQKQFVGIICVIGLGIIGLQVYKNSITLNTGFLYTLYLVTPCLILFFKPFIIKPLLVIWMCLGLVLGEITSIIILGLVFYLIFSPITIILRSRKSNQFKSKPQWFDNSDKQIDYKKLY